ncbi:MAG: RNA-protein complex protein Nop10 [Candidatus Lokiarchaeota archaeon]|jgi:H/ACA ribonucleoprotein complex subunit 3|nr:RNA-protein complex protein Nop10 [Candidatus Lokiarchaeota archaeon]
MTHLFKCKKCSRYTLDSETCPHCGGDVGNPHPARYSPQDKYGEYRRAAKRKSKSDLQ